MISLKNQETIKLKKYTWEEVLDFLKTNMFCLFKNFFLIWKNLSLINMFVVMDGNCISYVVKVQMELSLIWEDSRVTKIDFLY